jgi:hypothetical protein
MLQYGAAGGAVVQRVYLGEVDVAAGAATAARSAALLGNAKSPFSSSFPAASALVTFAHGIGTTDAKASYRLKSLEQAAGFLPGTIVDGPLCGAVNGGYIMVAHPHTTENAVNLRLPYYTDSQIYLLYQTDGSSTNIGAWATKWGLQLEADRGW